MRENGRIDYVELACTATTEMKAFYGAAFGWRFTDYGPDYAAFEEAGLDGGFDAEGTGRPPLVILYADDLEAMRDRVTEAGGVVTKAIFAFPGGRRFQFRDPSGNELGVWSAI